MNFNFLKNVQNKTRNILSILLLKLRDTSRYVLQNNILTLIRTFQAQKKKSDEISIQNLSSKNIDF